MSRNDLDRFFDQLESLSVGFAPVFREFRSNTTTYPPHNIVKISDDEFNIELAIAGFKKDEVSLEEHQGLLTIRGDKSTENDNQYQFRGIANRSFSKSFRIAEFYEVKSAKLEDGILTIGFVKNIPEEAKPKLIAIS